MIQDHSKLNDILDFAIREPESTDDLFQMMRDASTEERQELVELASRLLSAGVKVLKG